MSNKIYSILDKLLLIALCLPYAFIILGLFGPHNLFPLFAWGLILLLPAGLLTLFLELTKKIFKIEKNVKILAFSLVNFGFGVVGLMLIYVVTS
jgi:hypothetical protein